MNGAWKQILIAWLLGGVVGFAGARWSAPSWFHRHGEGKQAQARMLQRFSSKLRLTPDQRAKVAAIFEAKRQKIDALRAEVRPKFEEIRASTSAEIRALLTPEQQRAFDVMHAKQEARRKAWDR